MVGDMDPTHDILIHYGNLAALDSAFDQYLLEEARQLVSEPRQQPPPADVSGGGEVHGTDPTHLR